jgi:hypothetical protein
LDGRVTDENMTAVGADVEVCDRAMTLEPHRLSARAIEAHGDEGFDRSVGSCWTTAVEHDHERRPIIEMGVEVLDRELPVRTVLAIMTLISRRAKSGHANQLAGGVGQLVALLEFVLTGADLAPASQKDGHADGGDDRGGGCVEQPRMNAIDERGASVGPG